MASLDSQRLGLVFGTRPDIIAGVQRAADTPERITLFNSIASFVSDHYLSTDASGEPIAKRRRIDGQGDGAVHENGNEHGMLPPTQFVTAAGASQQAQKPGTDNLLIDMANAAAKEVVLLEVKEISVLAPQRKKYDLCFTKNFLYTKQMGTTAPVQGIVYEWSNIEFVFYTPVPDKQQLHYNYTVFPRNTALYSTKVWPPTDFEPLLFTVPTTAPKQGIVAGYAAQTAAQVSDSYGSLLHWAISSQLQATGNTTASIACTDPRTFSSSVKQPHRPNERAVHVKAFRGSKDGYLFFLPNGILWGYKKPLLFIPLDRIIAVSYVNVLQRTFNMMVEVDVSQAPCSEGQIKEEDRTEEIEFGMIDQEDYQNIDERYIRRHGLNNRSMAEGRKAKRQLRENAKDDAAGGTAVTTNGQLAAAEDDDMTGLDRTEQMIQDEEDEEEEDYDPGSEGESEGEGDSSEEDDDDDDDEEEEEDEDAEGFDDDELEDEVDADGHE